MSTLFILSTTRPNVDRKTVRDKIISYRFRDIAEYWSKIANPLYSMPPLGVKPSDLHNNHWRRKTRMMRLSDIGNATSNIDIGEFYRR